MQKYMNMYKDGEAKIFQQSKVNQPKQGHQPWQSNSLSQYGNLSQTPPKMVQATVKRWK